MKVLRYVVFFAFPVIAQAQIGKMAILDSLPLRGKCTEVPVSDRVRQDGVGRLYSFEIRSSGRMVTLATNPQGKPLYLMVMASHPLTASKGEGENLSVFFNGAGRIVRGDRMYMTMGQPASRAEDRKSGLLPEDTVKIERLTKAMLARCAG